MKNTLITLTIIAGYMIAAYFQLQDWWLLARLALGILIGLFILYVDTSFLQTYYRKEGEPLVTRSALFLLAFAVLAIFILSSSGSLIGMGIIVGMSSYYLVQLKSFNFGSQVKLSESELRLSQRIFMGFLLLVLIFSLL